MATIKVFSSGGVKELHCFDTLLDVPFDPSEEITEEEITEEETTETE